MNLIERFRQRQETPANRADLGFTREEDLPDVIAELNYQALHVRRKWSQRRKTTRSGRFNHAALRVRKLLEQYPILLQDTDFFDPIKFNPELHYYLLNLIARTMQGNRTGQTAAEGATLSSNAFSYPDSYVPEILVKYLAECIRNEVTFGEIGLSSFRPFHEKYAAQSVSRGEHSYARQLKYTLCLNHFIDHPSKSDFPNGSAITIFQSLWPDP